MHAKECKENNPHKTLEEQVKEHREGSSNIECLQTIVQEMRRNDVEHKDKEERLWKIHDVERMNADAFELLLVSLNEDHAKSQRESKATIKKLKCDVAIKNSECDKMKNLHN